MPDARIKDCVCAACAKKMGYEPSKDVAGVWMGECDFCGELKPLTSLAHDWKRTRTREEAAVAGDKETVAEIVSEMRGSTEQRYCSSKHCSVKVFNPILDFASRIEAAHRREVEELRECLKEAIYSACVKCTLYNSRRRQCSYSSGACNDVAKWRKALEGAKDGK